MRYYYQDGLLRWHWPLATGTRSTNLVCYDHEKDIKAVADLMTLPRPPGRGTFRNPTAPTSYTAVLSIRHGILDLDVVKDWVLKYPADAKRPLGLFDKLPVRPASTQPAQSGEAVTQDPRISSTPSSAANWSANCHCWAFGKTRDTTRLLHAAWRMMWQPTSDSILE